MTVLYKGTLKQNNESFHVTLLSLEHIEQILSLQNIVIEALEDKVVYNHSHKKNFNTF